MTKHKHLLVGGLVAMGFDASGSYLLTVMHSGRGVFSAETWERVARDTALAYPTDGTAIGIGPINGQVIGVQQRDERNDRIEMQSPDGRFHLVGESDGITIMRVNDTPTKIVYVVDGTRFSTLVEAAAEFTAVLGLAMPWNGNLDAFNDFPRGGFGAPDGGFVLIWQNSDLSRQRLGYKETLHWLEERVQHCHASNIAHFQNWIAKAQRQEGETLFDVLVSIIRDHSDIELRLE